MTINGIAVFVSQFAEKVIRKQIQFPRSKKRRIIKKWAKLEKNYSSTHEPTAYLVEGNKLICHPIIYESLRREIDR
jgi:hypothetical protein